MMPTRNVNLTEHFDRLIETGIISGRDFRLTDVHGEVIKSIIN